MAKAGLAERLPSALGVVAAVLIVASFVVYRSWPEANVSNARTFLGSTASTQVHEVIDLGDSNLHPRQLAYDPHTNGIWFWTSSGAHGGGYDNRLYRFDIATGKLSSWPLYSADWSSQLHAGLAVAPNGDVWVGWNFNLIDFHSTLGTYTRYVLPSRPRYPLPAAVLGDLPSNLGVTDLQIADDGTVWIARYGALSLTKFSPTVGFNEYPLPLTSGDPAKLAIAGNGHILFTTNFAADQPGYAAVTIGEFDPQTHHTLVYAQKAEALVVTSHGDVLSALEGQGQGIAQLSASEHAAAIAQNRAPVFQQRVIPFDVYDGALASDGYGRVWVAVAGQPIIVVYDTKSGQTHQYQYAAPSVAAHSVNNHGFGVLKTKPAPGALWLRRIVGMATDSQGHLWYVREGSDVIEEVAA